MISGGSGACRSRGRREAMPNPVSRTCRSPQFTRMLAGFRSLWTRPRWWSLAQGRGDAEREAQEALQLHGRAEQPLERLAARILEHQHGPTALAHELQGPRRPGAVQLILQPVFVRQAIEDIRWRVFRGEEHRQHGVPAAIGIEARCSAENAVAILPQDLEALIHRRGTASAASSRGLRRYDRGGHFTRRGDRGSGINGHRGGDLHELPRPNRYHDRDRGTYAFVKL